MSLKVHPEVVPEYPGRGYGGRGGHASLPILKLFWPDGGYTFWDGSKWMVMFADGKMVPADKPSTNLYNKIVGRK